MKCDIVLAGVGGQGVLSLGAIIASTCLRQGLQVKQSEVHGMSQRGGAVQAHLRLSEEPIHSDLIPTGTAEMVISLEPMESLRYLDYLGPDGILFTATEPVDNIPDYPLEDILQQLRALGFARLVEAQALAKQAGLPVAVNMVMVGAASPLLPVAPETIRAFIVDAFAAKGDRVVQANLEAFRLGREAVAH